MSKDFNDFGSDLVLDTLMKAHVMEDPSESIAGGVIPTDDQGDDIAKLLPNHRAGALLILIIIRVVDDCAQQGGILVKVIRSGH